jgi:hypothetical protein
MKTALLYRALVTLLFIPVLAMGNNTTLKVKHSKEKIIKKQYSVNADATLKIDNSYGNIDIVTWDENRVEIEVTITTDSNNEEKAQKRLDDITVEFEASASLVSAKTKFGNTKSNSWWNWGKKNNVSIKVNYVIKMPITNNVDLANDYGGINLDKLEGRANIDCDYGKVTTKELMADNNTINFDYTNKSYFEYIKSGKINADYSTYTVGKAKRLDINSDYTNSTIEIAEDINYNCDYGNMTIDKVNNVAGNGDYLTARIGDVYKTANVKASYGSLKIEAIKENASNVSIKTTYVGVKVGYDPAHNFNFDIDLQYASLRDHDGLEITKEHEKSSKKSYSGYYGNANSGSSINITSTYGNVSLYKN